jgi:hypothetical protein
MWAITSGLVDLADRLVQLGVADVAVGDDWGRIEYRLIRRVVQDRQPLRQPRNAVGLG